MEERSEAFWIIFLELGLKTTNVDFHQYERFIILTEKDESGYYFTYIKNITKDRVVEVIPLNTNVLQEAYILHNDAISKSHERFDGVGREEYYSEHKDPYEETHEEALAAFNAMSAEEKAEMDRIEREAKEFSESLQSYLKPYRESLRKRLN